MKKNEKYRIFTKSSSIQYDTTLFGINLLLIPSIKYFLCKTALQFFVFFNHYSFFLSFTFSFSFTLFCFSDSFFFVFFVCVTSYFIISFFYVFIFSTKILISSQFILFKFFYKYGNWILPSFCHREKSFFY